MDVGGAHARHKQIAAGHRAVVKARGTGVPSHMMQLVANTRHFQPVDHLGIGGAVRVGIDGAQIVGLLDARAGVDGNRVENLFTRRPDGIRWTGIARTTTFHSAFSALPTFRRHIRTRDVYRIVIQHLSPAAPTPIFFAAPAGHPSGGVGPAESRMANPAKGGYHRRVGATVTRGFCACRRSQR